jgi:hybrid cluster-associated redox disulfide protein
MADSTVAHVMLSWPDTIEVFMRRHMACVGCAMSRFCTVREAARAYELDATGFLSELQLASGGQPSASGEMP